MIVNIDFGKILEGLISISTGTGTSTGSRKVFDMKCGVRMWREIK